MTADQAERLSRYPSDRSDEAWEVLRASFEELEPYQTGRPRQHDLRDILHAIFVTAQVPRQGSRNPELSQERIGRLRERFEDIPALLLGGGDE